MGQRGSPSSRLHAMSGGGIESPLVVETETNSYMAQRHKVEWGDTWL